MRVIFAPLTYFFAILITIVSEILIIFVFTILITVVFAKMIREGVKKKLGKSGQADRLG